MTRKRAASGVEIDASWQYFHERPVTPGGESNGETVYATAPEPGGSERTENVPVPESREDAGPEREGQTTLADWGGEPGADD